LLSAVGLLPRPSVRARHWLTRAELALFETQSRADRRHAERVAERLLALGHADRLLLRAALLHDVGKAGRGVTLTARVVWVLAGRASPRLQAALARRGGAWAALADHATVGASRLRAAGVDPRIVAIVAEHPLPGDEHRARLIGEADDAV
jgi:putative nucleotidyltransferase with HDIG domain